MKLFGNKHGASQNTASFPAVPPETPAYEAPKEKKSRKGLIAGCVLGGLVLLAVVIFLVAALCVRNVDTVYPNVRIGDYKLGGFTYEEALDTLKRAEWADPENVALAVELPGKNFDLRYEDVGIGADAETAAGIAWDYGRDGNLITSACTYLRCMVGGKDLSDQVFGEPDATAVAQRVKTAVAEAQAELMDYVTVDVESETAWFVKGASHIRLDENEVTQVVLNALSEGQKTVELDLASLGQEMELNVEDLKQEICAEAQDAYYDKDKDEIVPEVVGIDFDSDEVKQAWQASEVGDRVEFGITVTEPEVTAEQLEAVLFHDLLAEKSTSLSGSSSNRINNVELAAKSINGIVLMPGEQFSYNEALGQRTKENGYLAAGAYANGAVVQEIGGGICQVSSTLYYCTLLSNLQIDYRVNHYFPVGYLPPGFDATVSWKSPDFKFTNDREYPIRLVAYVKDGSVTVEIWGTDNGTYVELTYASWLVYTNEEYPEVATGYKAQAYRSVYDSETGELIEKKSEGVGLYHYHEEDIKYPEPEPSPSPSPEVTPTPTPSPEVSPSPEVTTSPEVTQPPEVTASPEPTPTPVPTPEVSTDPVTDPVESTDTQA